MQTYYLKWEIQRWGKERNIMQRKEKEFTWQKMEPKEQKQIPHECFLILKNLIRTFNKSSKLKDKRKSQS